MKRKISKSLLTFCFVLVLLFFAGLGFWLTGCGRVVSSTTTKSTTTFGISGTISNYGGTESEIVLAVFKDTLFTGDATFGAAVVSGSQATYEVNVAAAGNYYAVAWDFSFGMATPEAGNYVGAYGWTGTDSLEAAGDSDSLNLAIGQNATSVEVASIATLNFTMHEIVAGTGVTVSASATYPSTVTSEASVRALLYKTSVLTSASDLTEMSYTYKVSETKNVSPGDTVNFSFANVGANSYYCILAADPGTNPTHWGAYGWTGTAEVSGATILDDSGDLWQNKTSFEVSTSAVNLGGISLHLVQ